MIGCEDRIGHTIDGIDTSRIDADRLRCIIRFLHLELTPLTLAYPVALHLLDPVGPVETIEIIDESICIVCDF